MPSISRLAEGYVELSLKDEKLKDRLANLGEVITMRGREYERALARSITDPLAKAEFKARLLKQRLGDAYRESMKAEYKERYGAAAGTAKYWWDQHGERARGMLGGAVRGAARLGVSAAGMGTGLAYAAAAAAGSTTLDTLTGSLKMFALEVGSKTQPAVLALSRKIQQLSKTVKESPEGTVGMWGGAAAGALLGSRFGPVGALIGGGIGAIAGRSTEKGLAKDERIEQIARSLVMGGEALATQAHRAVDAFGMSVRGKKTLTPAEMAQGEKIEEISAGIARAENPEFRKRKDEFLKAGIGGASFTELADLRKQAQLAVFSPEGPLGTANMIKELENNLKVINGPNIDLLKKIEENTRKKDVHAPPP